MNEIPNSPEVSMDSILEVGRQTGDNIRELDARGFRNTVNALIIYASVLPDQDLFNDPAVVTAADIATDFEYGSDQNATNLVRRLTEKGARTATSPVRIQQALLAMRDMTSDPTPDALYMHVQLQIDLVIGQLMQDGVRETIPEPLRKAASPNRIRDYPPRARLLLERFGVFIEALNELAPHLTHVPKNTQGNA